MMDRRKTIILGVSITIVLIFGTFILLTNQSQGTSINNTVTQQGTKLDIINGNTNNWESFEMVISNATTSNGTVKTFYMVTWIEPNSNMTIDLSNMLGYGNKTLPSGTVLNVQSVSSLYSAVPNTSNLSLKLVGWSNTLTPLNASNYNITHDSMPVASLPSSIKNNNVQMGYNQSDMKVLGQSSVLLYSQIRLVVGPDGNVRLNFTKQPTLYQPMQTSM